MDDEYAAQMVFSPALRAGMLVLMSLVQTHGA